MAKDVLACAIASPIERIFVIDNSPTDVLREVVCGISDKVEYIYGQGNLGYGAGHNIGLKKAQELGSKYHVVLNPDIHFDNGTIEALSEYADTHENIGMITPKVQYPDGRLQYLCKLWPTPMAMLIRRLLPNTAERKINNKFELRETGYDKVRNVPCLSGCFMFLNMEVINKVGMFDDRFFLYFEDTDLMRRIHGVAKNVFYPKITIIHHHAAEHKSNKKVFFISIASTIKYFNKWGWFFDAERKKVNKEALDAKYILE